MKKNLLLLLVLGLIPLAPSFSAAAEPVAPAKPWANDAELSYVSANGNTKSQTFSAKDTFKYDWTRISLELIGGAMSAKDRGESIAEKYNGSEKLSFKFTDRNYAYEKVGWDKDRFAGVKSRWDGSAGLGRHLIKTERNALLGEIGAGYIAEDRYNQPKNNFSTGRAYTKYVHTISPTSDFSQDAEYLQNFENPDDFRAKTETALTAAISAHFSMKAYFIWKHVGVPPVGFGRNDTTTGVALVAKY
jgi:putative salt-induced outer membrane protein YdiY